MKAEIDKPDINKLVNVLTDLNNLKSKIDIDAYKLKTVPVDLKKISSKVTKEVVKKTVYNKPNTKVNNS